MKPEDIKKIAEEYADMYMNRKIPLISKKDNIRNTLIRDAKTVLNIISERFYLVEKGKVEQEMINANQNIDLFSSYPKVRYVNEGVKRVLTKLFGPDIRKEEEK